MSAISCVIPTHGRPEMLQRSLSSVLNQTLPPDEVIVVDDVGDPETAQVVAEHSGGSTHIEHVMNRKGGGASGSRNLGAQSARGDFVAFLDDDDAWSPHFLEKTSQALWRSNAAVAIAGLRAVTPEGKEKKVHVPEQLDERSLPYRNPGFTGSNALFTKRAFETLDGFDPDLPVMNDLDLLLRLHRRGLAHVSVPEPLSTWFQHQGERISSMSLQRAAAIEQYRHKHLGSLSRAQRGELRCQSLGVQKAFFPGRVKRATLVARQILARGPLRSAGRVLRSRRQSRLAQNDVCYPHSRDGLGGSVVTGALLASSLNEISERNVTAVVNGDGPPLELHRDKGIAALTIEEIGRLGRRPPSEDGSARAKIMKVATVMLGATRYLRGARPSLVHVNDEIDAIGWGVPARLLGIPMIWQVHQQVSHPMLDRALLRLASGVVFVADSNRARFAGRRVPTNITLHNGVDLSVFHPVPTRAFKSEVVVGFVGNLVDRKRPDWLVRSVKHLEQRGVRARARFAGADYSGRASDELRNLANSLGVADRVELLGARNDVPAVINGLDILVLSSRADGEAFPRAIVEAMACGVPVVATDVAGVAEAVEDGVTGLLCDAGDHNGFTDAIERLAGDPGLRAKMGEAARNAAVSRFSLPDTARRLDDFYDVVLAQVTVPGR